MTYKESYERGKRVLAEAGIDESELDARLLLEHICGTCRNDLLAHGDREVSRQEQEAYLNLLERRGERIPLQYVLGVQDFMGLEFKVNENVLIPRQDTEILVEEALRELHDGMDILDLCTGSGCILLSLLLGCPGAVGVGSDISLPALKIAEKNRALWGQEALGVS